MTFGKNKVNNEMDNLERNIVEDAKTYLTKYIKIVNDKQVLIYSVSATNDNIKAHTKDKKKLIKQRFKSLLKTKKSIKNNIELIHSSLKKLPKEPQPKLIKLIRLDTTSNNSINIVWRKIYDRERKTFKKIGVN